jgi:hypothetical protein
MEPEIKKARKLYFNILFVYEHFFLNILRYLSINRVRVMEFNATFNNISAISWLSVLLVEETGVP